MTFKEAQNFRMPFGKYKGMTLDDIAVTNEGLKYLDWLLSIDLQESVKEAVTTYLNDPAIKRDLEQILDE